MSDMQTEAVAKLENESKSVSGRYQKAMAPRTAEALVSFCRQDEEFAQAVAQGKSFQLCMDEVAKGVGESISDLDAFRRAVGFFFPGADIHVDMTVDLCASVGGSEPEKKGLLINLDDLF